MHDLGRFSVGDTAECAAIVQQLGLSAQSLEGFAQPFTTHLYERLGDGDGGRGTALVRFFKTLPCGRLERELASEAAQQVGTELDDELRCLVLLGSAGERPDWNGRRRSREHRVIALPSAESVQKSPMLSQLVRQLGLEVADVVRPSDGAIVELRDRTYNVFFVPDALGSPDIPNQSFVRESGVRSVVGFGGMLPSGDLFASILFTKLRLAPQVAELFRVLAVSVKAAAVRFDQGPTLES